MKKEFLKKIKLPDKPGVYLFKKGKNILYIGKATSLKDRVRSYFSGDISQTRGLVIAKMLQEFDTVEHIATDSVLEALILEAELIKKYQPKANSKEKDDKSFNYVVITKEKLPKVVVMRGQSIKSSAKKIGSSSVFGPFTNPSQLHEAMKIIRRIFPYLDDKSKNYLEFYKQINLIPDLDDRKLYLQNIKNIKLFFSGKKRQILTNLKKEMKMYAKAREFEKAGEIKRQLFALQHINDVALLKYSLHPDPLLNKERVNSIRIEAYDIAHMSGKNMVGVMMVVENGLANKGEYRRFKIRGQVGANDTGALTEVLDRRIGHPEWKYPDLIVVDGSTAQINFAKSVLSKYGMEVPIVAVTKNERHKPEDIKGDSKIVRKYEREILLANSEAHRFAITFHKLRRDKNFLPKLK